jgi:hypothetical protein
MKAEVEVAVTRFRQPGGAGTAISFNAGDIAADAAYVEFTGLWVRKADRKRFPFRVLFGQVRDGGGKVVPATPEPRTNIATKMVTIGTRPRPATVTTSLFEEEADMADENETASSDASLSPSVRSIHHRWIAPRKLKRRLGPGTLDVIVDMSGSVHGAFSPGGIARPGRPDVSSSEFAMHIEPLRGEHLWRLLDHAHFDTLATETVIPMGEGEPIEVGRKVNETEANKAFIQSRTPSGLEPFLAELRMLADELVEHPKR